MHEAVRDAVGPARVVYVDNDPAVVAHSRALPPGSYLAISHFCHPGSEHPEWAEATAKGERLLAETLGSGRWRSRQEILGYFGDLELIEPGLVPLAAWRPNRGAIRHPEEVNHSFLGGVARNG